MCHSQTGTSSTVGCIISAALIVKHTPLLNRENTRTVEVGRGLWRPPSPTLLLKQVHLETLAQHHVQAAFQYLQGWRLHDLCFSKQGNRT